MRGSTQSQGSMNQRWMKKISTQTMMTPPLWVHSIDDLIGDADPPGVMHRVLNAGLNFTSTEEPVSFNKAEKEAV
jgi:hypothetical protein